MSSRNVLECDLSREFQDDSLVLLGDSLGGLTLLLTVAGFTQLIV
jgi:hypothetical protein